MKRTNRNVITPAEMQARFDRLERVMQRQRQRRRSEQRNGTRSPFASTLAAIKASNERRGGYSVPDCNIPATVSTAKQPATIAELFDRVDRFDVDGTELNQPAT